MLTARMGRAPGEAEVAAEMALSLEEYQQLLGDLKGLEIGTLHVERNEDSGEEELAYVPGQPRRGPALSLPQGRTGRAAGGGHRRICLTGSGW